MHNYVILALPETLLCKVETLEPNEAMHNLARFNCWVLGCVIRQVRWIHHNQDSHATWSCWEATEDVWHYRTFCKGLCQIYPGHCEHTCSSVCCTWSREEINTSNESTYDVEQNINFKAIENQRGRERLIKEAEKDPRWKNCQKILKRFTLLLSILLLLPLFSAPFKVPPPAAAEPSEHFLKVSCAYCHDFLGEDVSTPSAYWPLHLAFACRCWEQIRSWQETKREWASFNFQRKVSCDAARKLKTSRL